MSPMVPAFAGDRPFTGPANWGGTGLMETPTARIMSEGRYRFGAGQIDPYRYYYGAISPFDGLEIDGRVTEVLDLEVTSMPGYGNYKDKAVDIKYRVLPEGKWLPAIAVGLMDPHGTRLYSSQYVVLSKQFYPFDLTVGFGNGRFGKKPLSPTGDSFKAEMFTNHSSWRADGQFFGGIQFAPTDDLTFMVEYSPVDYEKQTNDPARDKYFTEAVSSPFNFGIRWKPLDWLEADVSYQRGDRIGLNVSTNFELGNPLIPIYDHPYKEKPITYLSPLKERIVEALYQSGFSNIGVKWDGDAVRVDAENDKFYYNPKAIGVALRALAPMIPVDVQKVYFTLTENDIPVLEFETSTEDLIAFDSEHLSVSEFLYLSRFRTDVWKTPDSFKSHRTYFDYNLKPDFKMFLNDPSGFFKYRFGILGQALFTPARGSTFAAGLVGYPLNTVSSANKPSSQPVRTDTVAYQEQDVLMHMLLFDHIEKFKYNLHGRIAAGYLEEQYMGADGEVAMPLFGGRIMAGLAGSIVKKRDPGHMFKLKKNDWKNYYKTAFLKLRLTIPEADINIDLKNGQFLAGDRGTSITVSRDFNGVVISAWYSITGTSMFNDSFNRGYHDKGISVSIPFRLFTGKDSRSAYGLGLSPWTRDVAQDIVHFNDLFDFIGRNTKVYIDKDKRMIQ
ncbi:MAG: YjbH domain-containing protein [Deltaproteobacteria bacterium]|nr:YjbH domain-containing protein [Deltaproteobacteria bacterium]